MDLLHRTVRLAKLTPILRPHLLPMIRTALRQKQLVSLLSKPGTFGVVSAFRPGSKQFNSGRHGELMGDLQRLGHRKIHTLKSRWEGVPEKSLLVPNIKPKALFDLMRKYNQDAVIYKAPDGVVGLYYQDGFAEVALDPSGDPAFDVSQDKDLYSKTRNWSFDLNFVWGKKIPFDGRPPIKREDAKAALAQAAA